jgi:hypothetical protein
MFLGLSCFAVTNWSFASGGWFTPGMSIANGTGSGSGAASAAGAGSSPVWAEPS